MNVAGVALKGGTPEERRALLSKKLDAKLDRVINLTDQGTIVTRKRRDLGVKLDLDRMLKAAEAQPAYVPLMLDLDIATSKRALRRIAPRFNRPPTDAKPYMYRGQFFLRPSVEGRNLTVPTTAELMRRALLKRAALQTFPVTVTRQAPKITSQALKGINGRLSTYTTLTTTDQDRNHNVDLAAQLIDGTILSPGETFSLNKTVGPRTKGRGFREATVFEDAKPVPGIGGGVSQITGTIFNAAALAGLAIVEVNPHSRPVSYIPIGRDATVAWEAKDLRFRNNTKAPVYIAYKYQNQRLQASIYGKTVKNRRVRLKPEVARHAPGHVTAKLYRTIKVGNDTIAKERLLSHTYRWDPST